MNILLIAMLVFGGIIMPANEGKVMKVGPDTASISVEGAVYHNAMLASGVSDEDIYEGDLVSVHWVRDQAYITGVLEETAGAGKRPRRGRLPPPHSLTIHQGDGAYLTWSWDGKDEQLAYFEVGASFNRLNWADVTGYPVSEGTRRVHYPRTSHAVYMRVRAVGFYGGSTSRWSAPTITTVVDNNAPDTPTDLSGLPGEAPGTVRLSWSQPSLLDTPDLAGFEVYVAQDEDGTGEVQLPDVGPVNSAMFSSPYIGVCYWSLVAYDRAGNHSAQSARVAVLPAPPTGVNLLTNSDFEIVSSWDEPFQWDWFYSFLGTATHEMSATGVQGTLGSVSTLPDEEGFQLTWPTWSGSVPDVSITPQEGMPYCVSMYIKTGVPTSDWELWDGESWQDAYGTDGKLGVQVYTFWERYVGLGHGPGTWTNTKMSQEIIPVGDGWYRVYSYGIAPQSDRIHEVKIAVANRTGAQVEVIIDRPQLSYGTRPIPWVPSTVSRTSLGGMGFDVAGVSSQKLETGPTGLFQSNLEPDESQTRDIGLISKMWRYIFGESGIFGTGVVIGGGTGDFSGDMTCGLTINQGASDDQIIALKSSDVSHAAYDAGIEADTFARFVKLSGAAGGLAISGLRDDTTGGCASLMLQGLCSGDAQTGKGTTNEGIIALDVYQASGGGLQNIVTDGNIFTIRCRRSGTQEIVFTLAENGNLHLGQNGEAILFFNETTNPKMTTGVTINQGANDDEILALKSSDVAHSLTDVTEADTYGLLKKYSADAGGLLVEGFRDADAAAGVRTPTRRRARRVGAS
jgi:hypothetical protein